MSRNNHNFNAKYTIKSLRIKSLASLSSKVKLLIVVDTFSAIIAQEAVADQMEALPKYLHKLSLLSWNVKGR